MACIFGAFGMFIFAFGLSAPIIVGSMLAGRLSEKIKHLREIRLVGATIMIVSGLLLMTATIMRLII
jgi:cytochrome c biogenesis protein CcdA